MTAPLLRSPQAGDAPAIAGLLDELGYPATAGDVVERLARLADFPHAVALVAELDGRVVGVATGHLIPSIHSTPPVAYLTTLAVSSAARAHGVGRELTAGVEEWARQAGAVRLSITSGSHRDATHAFYERIGFERSGVRLTKTLA